MIRNRTNSQKPDDGLIQQFQRTFSDIIIKQGQGDLPDQTSNEPMNPSRSNSRFSAMKLKEQARCFSTGFQMSSPFVDPNLLDFPPFANQSHSFYPQSSGCNGFHSQHAGDLHTPMGSGMANPFSRSLGTTASTDADATNMDLNQLSRQFFASPIQNPQFFTQQPSFAPSAFQQDPGFDLMDESIEKSSLNELESQDPSSKMPASDVDMADQSEHQNLADQKFQYNTTLHAPTAMMKDSEDIPITYLNKGQVYSLSVADTNPPSVGSQLIQYRTSIRLTFQEEEQRRKSGACWQLWKEGRGTSEASQRCGKIQALEYVNPSQCGNEDRKAQVRVESTTVDGFCVIWTANPSIGASECTVPLRFNCLSTDFSHFKGVKGIPLRLCAKTEVTSGAHRAGTDQKALFELCFCKVKLFRDHGAERKFSHDVAHVKKTIEKLKQQIIHAEMGGGNNNKRKRASASVTSNGGDHHPPKINKHKRTWSMNSRNDVDRVSLEDDLHTKLAVMQKMLTSTSPVSSLNMQADIQDDPDVFPMQLPKDVESFFSSQRQNAQNLRLSSWTLEGATTSPVTSSLQNVLSHTPNDSGYQTSFSSRGSSLPVSENSSQPTKVQRANSNSNVSTRYLQAVNIDPMYRLSAEHRIKPIACFYLRFSKNEAQKDKYFHAVYLSERTVKDLMDKISVKCSIDIKRVLRILLVWKGCVNIMVDDDVVREFPDGLGMDVEISETADTSESPDDSRLPALEMRLR